MFKKQIFSIVVANWSFQKQDLLLRKSVLKETQGIALRVVSVTGDIVFLRS